MALGARHFLDRQLVREFGNVGMASLATENAVNRRTKLLGIDKDAMAFGVHKAMLPVAGEAIGTLECARALRPNCRREQKRRCHRHNASLPTIHVRPSFQGAPYLSW